MLMVSSSKRGAEEDDPMQPDDEPDLDRMTQLMQDLFKFKLL